MQNGARVTQAGYGDATFVVVGEWRGYVVLENEATGTTHKAPAGELAPAEGVAEVRFDLYLTNGAHLSRVSDATLTRSLAYYRARFNDSLVVERVAQVSA